MLKCYLMTDHQLSVAAYKATWKLPKDCPLVAPNYSAQRSALALKIGRGRKPGQRKAKSK
jgi:predicted transcriptional regulator